MKTKETPEALRPYSFHGVEFSLNGTQAMADCPFCNSTDKFFINQATGQYDCKRCGLKGNKVTFLTEYHRQQSASTTVSDLSKIRKLRDNVFPTDFLKSHGLCFDAEGCILFPVQIPGKKNLNNLRKWQPSNKTFYNTPGCCSLFVERWNDKGPVLVCEGEWDALALGYLMLRSKYTDPCSIVAVPGANIFKDTWIPQFKDRDVILLYDNDHDKERADKSKFNPAKDGMKMVGKKLFGIASSINMIDWNIISNDLKDGYDIRDYLSDAIKSKKSRRALKLLLSACQPASEGSKHKRQVRRLNRESFDHVLQDWKAVYEFSESFSDVLACCFATLISLHMSDRRNPLWMFIVAPPSSGKTSIIEGFKSVKEHTEYVSELTPASIVTGLKYDSDTDPSLLNTINEKVLFIEDFTPILNMPGRDEVFGIFRAAYNGFYTARFASTIRDYEDLYFAMIAGVTPVIERINLGDFGERFLRIRLLDDFFNEDLHIQRALDNVGLRDDQKDLLLGGTDGFIEYMVKNVYEPGYNSSMDTKLLNLSKFAALLRTEIHRDKRGIPSRPVTEVASRIATQLKKLGIALTQVYRKEEVDDDCYRVMRKVAFDTCVGWFLELIQVLSQEESMSTSTISERMNIHPNQVRKIAEDAMQLNIISIKRRGGSKGIRGTKAISYCISDKLKSIMELAEIDFRKQPIIETYSPKSKRFKSLKRKRK